MPTQEFIAASAADSSGWGPGTRGLQNIQTAQWDLGVAQPVQHPPRGGERELAGSRAQVVRTCRFTGCSPNEEHVKCVGRDPLTGHFVEWGSANQAISEAQSTGLGQRMQSFWRGGESVCRTVSRAPLPNPACPFLRSASSPGTGFLPSQRPRPLV
jgi:hypothetical protein